MANHDNIVDKGFRNVMVLPRKEGRSSEVDELNTRLEIEVSVHGKSYRHR